MTDLSALLADLTAESAELDTLVAPLGPDGWRRATPAPGWTVAHQIAHLAWTDRAAAIAAADPDEFGNVVTAALADPTGFVDAAAEAGAQAEPAEILRDWRAARTALADALAATPTGTKLPWFGPPMSVASMATARLMETWAHGQDVADTIGVTRPPTDRLRHVAHIGTRTIAFAFTVHGLPVPEDPFRVELTGPNGDLWTWGPEDAADRISGPALDFCLLVTQRRNPADLAVRVAGEQAWQWLPIAQAFAGPPGTGRAAGAFA
ncbi:MAG TPA: TIGR03084 family metal-binding protein [Pseudonocardiaceae bacterium]|nr:TIGR03084 family metal-binding protein [Pseudonocardiaceae bacterium]